MAQAYDVVVIGGGIVGTATAFELGVAGARALLVDRADAGRATAAGAGILSPETAKRDDAAWIELVLAAGRHYEALIGRLDADNGWARCGILQVATRETDLSAWEWVADRAQGATEISPDDARAMVPVLGPVLRALCHPQAARVDGRRCQRDHARGVAGDARPRERDAGRGPGRLAPHEHRRLAAARPPARDRQRVRGNGTRRQRTAARSGLRKARGRPGHRPSPNP